MKNLIKKERFDKVFDIIKAGGFADKVHPEESKIRIEEEIKNGKSQYIFNIKKTDVDGVREQSLDRNDIFVPSSWSILLGLRSTTNPQLEKLYSFAPICKDEHSVHTVGFKSDSIEALYSGYLQWLVDNAVMLSTYPMEKFRKVPETQGAFLLDQNDGVVNEGILPEWDLADALELIIPRMTIAGTRDHKIAVNFDASGLQFPVTEGYKAYLVLMMDGFLIKGGCEYSGGRNPFGDVVGQW